MDPFIRISFSRPRPKPTRTGCVPAQLCYYGKYCVRYWQIPIKLWAVRLRIHRWSLHAMPGPMPQFLFYFWRLTSEVTINVISYVLALNTLFIQLCPWPLFVHGWVLTSQSIILNSLIDPRSGMLNYGWGSRSGLSILWHISLYIDPLHELIGLLNTLSQYTFPHGRTIKLPKISILGISCTL
jgi:hypothetical protein